MKKLLVTLLMATTTLSFVGCGTKAAESEKEGTITVSVQAETLWMPYYEKVAETIEKEYPNANIELKEIGCFDHLEILNTTDATNPDLADVFSLPDHAFIGLAKNQALAAIDAEKMAEEVGGFKDFKGGLGGKLQLNGEYLAFPYNIETLVAFVNEENAKAAGIDTSKPVEMTDLKYDQLISVVHDGWYGVSFTNSVGFELLNQDADGKFYSDATKNWSELTKEQQELFEGLFNYWKEHNTARTNLWDKDASWGYMDSQFKTGGPDAIKIDGPWGTPIVKELLGENAQIGVMPLTNITFNNKPLLHWKSGWGLGVNARCEEDEAKMEVATAFIKEIVNPENAKDLFLATGKVLENAEPSSYEGINDLDKRVIDATYEGYEKAVTRPLVSEYEQVWPAWQNALLSWSSKKPANAEAAYEQVKASFNDLISLIQK